MELILVARLVAAACLLCGSIIWGMSWTFVLERRPRELREMRTALQMLETEISYAATPLPDAFRLIRDRFQGNLRDFFDQLVRELGSKHTAGHAWQSSVDTLYGKMAWTQEDRSILLALAPTLGQSDRQDQLKHLRLCQERLAMAEQHAHELARKHARLYRSMGVLVGLLLVLLTW